MWLLFLIIPILSTNELITFAEVYEEYKQDEKDIHIEETSLKKEDKGVQTEDVKKEDKGVQINDDIESMEINITTSTVELNDSQIGFDKIEVCKNFNSEKNSNEPILEKKKKTSRFKK
ncbi:hypothetical protein A0H76_3036, partial [Hepatospora eriocheir]